MSLPRPPQKTALPLGAASVPPVLTIIAAAIALGGTTAAARADDPPTPTQAPSSPSQPVSAQSPAAAAQDAANLVVVATEGVTSSAPNRGAHDFGQVSLLDTTQVEQTFTLRNDGKVPIAVERVKASCGCTSTVVQKQGADASAPAAAPGAPLPTLAPGEEMTLRAVVDLSRLSPGPVVKTVSVYAQGSAEPVAVSEVRGTLLPSVRFTPALANFGRVSYGSEQVLTVTAIFDPRLVSAGPVPALVSSHPAVRISLASDAGEKEVAPSGGNGGNAPARTYRLTLGGDVPLGSLTGVLSFSPPAKAASDSAVPVPSPNVAAALNSARLVLVGQVVGDVSAQPPAVALGMVEKGQEATRQIVLTGKDAATLKELKVTCSSTWLTARPVTDPGAAGAVQEPAQTLDVTLAPGTPPGVLQTQIQITLANGQRLVIPVTAYVKP